MDIILQFNNNIHNDNKTQKHISEILKFYIKRNKSNLNLINKDEIKKLTSEYENLEFHNINKQYCENQNELDDNLLDFKDVEYEEIYI